ncbi:polyprenyl synthetase family protein [Kribbella catacumbae]|uniref:polyprenyl synthetase family protein n=1 Tax=Kribbella catacumbae TaxID=460086 RepID=UPI00035E046A|nr:polyprenyl synthetase family protein [Kribbella catacumbae]
MLTKETPTDFSAQVSARMLELAAALPSSSQQVVVSPTGEDLRRTLVEACAGHAPSAALPPVVTLFAVRVASIVELLHLASLLPDDSQAVFGLAAKEAAELGGAVKRAVAATAADLKRGELVQQRTGQLFRLACVLGGQLAGRSEADLEVLGRFGMDLGAAFQSLDETSDLEEARDCFRRALAQLDELSDQRVRERIVGIAQTEWSRLQ